MCRRMVSLGLTTFRAKSNEANHEIVLMSVDEGSRLVAFIEMLLRVIYELPALVPALPTVAEPPTEATE